MRRSAAVAVAAARAAVAHGPRAARGALFAEKRRRTPIGIENSIGRSRELKHRLAAVAAQTGLVGLLALRAFRGNVVAAARLLKHRARLHEAERHIVGRALLRQPLHPLVAARPRADVVLAAAYHLLNLPRGQIALRIHRAYERRRHEALVARRHIEQQRQALVGAPLVLAGHRQHHILVAVAPVGWQAPGYAGGPFREQAESHVAALAHHAPRLGPPLVGLLHEEIRRQPHIELLPAAQAVIAAAVAAHRQVKTRSAHHARSIHPTLPVEEIHVAMLAPLTHLVAPMPRIPYDHTPI